MNTLQIEFPDGAIQFETELEWISIQQEYGQHFNEEIAGYPERFPCVGFKVHTQYNQFERDCQIWAFVYPSIPMSVSDPKTYAYMTRSPDEIAHPYKSRSSVEIEREGFDYA